MPKNKVSVYLSYLLRHNPESVGLSMDLHGWVDVQELIRCVNEAGKYPMDNALLQEIVAEDNKGRYRFNEDGTRIKACQGHSLDWVIPELIWRRPPDVLYHGTTRQAYGKIRASGYISKMSRHAVHMQEDRQKAWQSAKRWKLTPVLLKIDARKMYEDGMEFGVSDNNVWCTDSVPVQYICEVIDTE